MKHLPARTALLGFALSSWIPVTAALADAPPAPPVAPPVVATPPSVVAKDPIAEARAKEQETLSAENKLEAERLIQSTNSMRAEVTRLKMERELAN